MTYQEIVDIVTANGLMKKATVTLTDAQIKSLFNEGQFVLVAGESGKMKIPVYSILRFNNLGNYTNIDPSAILYIAQFGLGGGLFPLGEGIRQSSSGSLSYFLAGSDSRIAIMSQGKNIFNNQIQATLGETLDSDGTDIKLYGSNGILGDLTGGNAANTLTVTIFYTVVDL